MKTPVQEPNKKTLAKYWAITRKNYNPYQIAALKAQEEFFLVNFWPEKYLKEHPESEKFYTDLLVHHLQERSELPDFKKTKDSASAKKYISNIHDFLIGLETELANCDPKKVEYEKNQKKQQLEILDKHLEKLNTKIR